MRVDARTVNDVKVSEDGRTAVISREGASNRKNGLVILDVSNPTDGVRVIARYDDQLNGGVHNVFISDGHVYALSNGRRYDVINIEDPTNPYRVGRFELPTPGHGIHDVWVVDGIAYSSNWHDGVVAVDVGGGGKGGAPNNPVMLGSQDHPSGWNHVDISGELRGDLYRQGREIAFWHPYDPESFKPNAPFVWAPQPYKGHIFIADFTSGLWAVKLVEPEQKFMGENY